MNSIRSVVSLFVFLFCIALFQVHAIEEVSFERISDNEDLSHNTVRCMLQDSKGFIWAGTLNGLNRYNGKEFETLLPQFGDFADITDNRIRTIIQDAHGYIWMYTLGNIVCCYDTRLERFIDYAPADRLKNYWSIRIFSNDDVWLYGREKGCCYIRHTENGGLLSQQFGAEVLGSNHIAMVYECSKKYVWILTAGGGKGVFRMENGYPKLVSTEEFRFMNEFGGKLFFVNDKQIAEYDGTQLRQISSIPMKITFVNNVTMLDNGVILISTMSGMLAFDCKKNQLIPAEPLFSGQSIKGAFFTDDNKGKKWVYSGTGVIWRQTGENIFTKIELIPPHILVSITNERYSIYQDSRNIVWITTYGNGLFAIFPNGRIQHYTTVNSNLSSNFLLCVMEDKSGEIWIGTENGGITKISINNLPVEIILPNKNQSNNLDNAVRMISQNEQNQFWIGTRSGFLYLYDTSLKLLQTTKIYDDIPLCIVEDVQKRLWLGTRKSGLQLSVDNGKHFSPVKINEVEAVYDMLIDTKNRLWLATFGRGLYVADLNAETVIFQSIRFVRRNHNFMRVLCRDSEGLIWVGTNEGVIVFNPDELMADKNKFVNFRFDVKKETSLSNNEVKAILKDSKGRLWFGTTGGGLNLFERTTPLSQSSFRHFIAKNGLSNEMIQAIAEDDSGNIWVSTESGSGISRFDVETERFENFTVSKGRHSGLFNENAGWKMQDGRLLFGGYAGLYIFNPAEMKLSDYAPHIIINKLKINGITVKPNEKDSPLAESVTLTSKIRLKYNQNSFNLEFAMLNFFQPNNNQYAYYLDGFEKDWNPATRYNAASYRNVPPGKYVFKVRGCSSLGTWTDEETELSIIISPPFYKTSWAYLIYFALLAASIYFTIRLIMKFALLRNEIEMEKKLTDYKLHFFTNISHEFRTPLTIIRGVTDSLADDKTQPAKSRLLIEQLLKSSSRLLRLVDQLLEFRKLQNNRLELQVEPTEAVAYLHEIYQTFKQMAEKKKIDFRFESDLSQKEVLLDRSKWDIITNNLLSNAMKHTPENGIIAMRLLFSEHENRMTLSVADSGTGVPKEKQNLLFERFAKLDSVSAGIGIGLHLTAELASIHKGKVEYVDSEWGGACFCVYIPLFYNSYHKADRMGTNLQPASAKIITDRQALENISSVIPQNKQYRDYKLLIIEDDDEVLEFIACQLGEYFTIIVAKDGVEGLKKAESEQPDMIVCDVMMPGVDGFEVTRRLKNDFLTSHIPIILLTAHSSEEFQLAGIQAGADAYIFKPFSIKYLITRIIKLIEQREKLQQKFMQSPGNIVYTINVTDKDKEFLDKIHALIEKNIENVDFSVEDFAKSMNMGRTNFNKKVKGITGHAPHEYMSIIRMKKAAEILVTTNLNISEISYAVGFDDPLYFSKCFKTQFGKTPSQFRKESSKTSF